MNKFLRYFLFSLFLIPVASKAQFSSFKDSVVQLYGVVMTADSLQAVEGVTIKIKGQNRGTITNKQGVFSIVALKGDVLEFTSIGFKPKKADIPKDLVGNQHSIIQLMVNDTIYLAATIIKPRPTREQFERDFVNAKIPDDNLEIARKNNDADTRRLLMATLPQDAKEATNAYFTRQAAKNYYSGQLAPQNIFNPLAWAEFIQAWKRGDFKSK
jgi:hypothetical protein